MTGQAVLTRSDRLAATLLDLRLHATQVADLLAGVTPEAFLGDRKLRGAIMFYLVRIAESVRCLPAVALAQYPDVDWPALGRFTAERSYEMSDDEWPEVWRIAAIAVPTLLRLHVPVEIGAPESAVQSDPNTARLRVELPQAALADFCQRWRVAELAVFGSALRDDFGTDSDVDFLVAFEPTARWGLFDKLRMQDELAALLGRKVDLIDRRAIEASPNWIRRRSILSSARPIQIDGCF